MTTSGAARGAPSGSAGEDETGLSPDTGTTTRRRRRRAILDEPLGSLALTTSVATLVHECPRCGSDALTQVPLRAPSGERVTFVSCQDCEHRSWLREDGSVSSREELLGAPDRGSQPPPRPPRQYRPGR